MTSPLINHILIGPPGAGKSTIAQQWIKHDPQCIIIETDRIRTELYGNSNTQGHWPEIETAVLEKINAAILEQHPVIYDATNAQRPWRLELLQKLNQIEHTQWIGWHLKTSLGTCKAQNQMRDRQVPDFIIEQAFQNLQIFPPETAEGFADVQDLPLHNGNLDYDRIKDLSHPQKLYRRIQSRVNKAAKLTLHPYSRLIDFERLMHLLSVLLHFPGLGQLSETNPSLLRRELNIDLLPSFSEPIDEITAVIGKQRGQIYADPIAIAQDLLWLEKNGIVNSSYNSQQDINLETTFTVERSQLHRYSDRDIFLRLMGVIRFIAHYPFTQDSERNDQQSFVKLMEDQGILPYGSWHNFRRDIHKALKIYRIMENRPMRKGYFVGTAILAPQELLKLAQVQANQAQHLQDPAALEIYEILQERMSFLDLDVHAHYPVRRVINHPIFMAELLPNNSLAQPNQQAILEDAIQQGQLIELRRLRGTGRHVEDKEEPFYVWPLQIVYYNIGWYLGYERESDGLFKFERIDRLEAKPAWQSPRDRAIHYQALDYLTRLQQGSYSLFLGNNPQTQKKFLSADPAIQGEVTATLELWFTDKIFRFTSEGTQRLPKLRMSPRIHGASMRAEEKKQIFNLSTSKDPHYPNRLKAVLPHWSLQMQGEDDDYELMKWLLQFGNEVKIISPEALKQKVLQKAKQITSVYHKNNKSS